MSDCEAAELALIAVVFRGDRGLELLCQNPKTRLLRLRSSFGATEDWNKALAIKAEEKAIAVVFRGDRGLELKLRTTVPNWARLRSSFGATEDWNVYQGM